MKNIGILIEMDNNEIKATNAGVITLAGKSQENLTALVLHGGESSGDPGEMTEFLGRYGISRIIEVFLPLDPEICFNPVVRAGVVVSVLEEYGIDTLLGLSGGEGKDMLPRIAAQMDAPLVMDCVDLDLKENIGITSQYSGKTLARIEVTGDRRVFGIRPNSISPRENPQSPEVVKMSPDPAEPDNFRIIPGEITDSDSDQVSLAEADIIIAGGRGMKSEDNFKILFECAQKLKGGVGASRVAVDNGWIPYAHQVGQTGEKVSPSVYIACGISGSIQHFAGMKTAKMIIAVNQDEKSAIVANSDYYIIGDLFEIIPELIRIL
ncbi:electron transfer flavoprotein subunit alpha/FixB family protein [Desulfospira joergensenii]|uniref:electron transfer flavoprotein subunit alpha/FixB family protein n=1 Tax=Desulfospira joergensenii TaxID=53329 RepID=UPI0003B5E4AD|nr:electron transfer flavoprotein subunit alpha/FixB family protein [Desulfospira joergensenii]